MNNQEHLKYAKRGFPMNSGEAPKKSRLSTPDAHQLRQERLRNGWTQEELADLVGVTPLTIRRWEAGSSIPHPYYREILAGLFGERAQRFEWNYQAKFGKGSETSPSPTALLLGRYRRKAGLTQNELAAITG